MNLEYGQLKSLAVDIANELGSQTLQTISGLDGLPSIALYFFYRFLQDHEPSDRAQMETSLLQAIQLDRTSWYPTLNMFGGSLGAGWVAAHIYRSGCVLPRRIISLLLELDSEVARAATLADSVCGALLRLGDRSRPYVYPAWLVPGGERGSSGRVAWCYSDLGVCAALVRFGLVSGKDDVVRLATEQAVNVLRIDQDDSGVVDCGLCHGAAGLVHLAGRFNQWTGDGRFAQLTSAWLNRLVGLRTGFGCRQVGLFCSGELRSR